MRGGTLVDVGAAAGELGAHLRDDFTKLIGIEGDPARVPDLAAHFDSALIADLNQLHRLPRADAFVLADILEHLPYPGPLLETVGHALVEQGRAYISVPNVANITVRLALLAGRWNYAEKGILDRSHLRFFTRRTIVEELQSHGFTIDRVEATTMPIRLVLEGSVPDALLRFLERILLTATRLFPTVLGYQWVVTARRERARS